MIFNLWVQTSRPRGFTQSEKYIPVGFHSQLLKKKKLDKYENILKYLVFFLQFVRTAAIFFAYFLCSRIVFKL